MKKLLPLVLIAVLAVVAVLVAKPSHMEANVAEASENALQYPVDLSALRIEFRQNGAIILRVPTLGDLRISGEEYNLTSEGNRSLDAPHIAILGGIHGYPNSTANILIGEHGIYGSVAIPVSGSGDTVRYEFNAIEVGKGYELRVSLDEDSASPHLLGPPST